MSLNKKGSNRTWNYENICILIGYLQGTSISVLGAPEGTVLVVQSDSGVWAV